MLISTEDSLVDMLVKSTTLPPNVCHVVAANPLFDFEASLKAKIDCDRLDYHSPPGSLLVLPTSSPYPDSLSDLSPLTTPESSPCPSPIPSSFETLLPGLPLLAAQQISHTPLNDDLERPSTSQATANGDLGTQPTKKKKKPGHRKARQHAAQKAWRQKRRFQERNSVDSHYQSRTNARRKYVEAANTIQSAWDASCAAITRTAFVAAKHKHRSKRLYSLEEMVGVKSKWKFQKVRWDGSTPTAILDQKKRIVGILTGHPDDKQWPTIQSQAAAALEAQRQHCYVPKARRKHRRGAFVALSCGVSHGGGQRVPSNLKNDSPNAEILEELNNMEPFRRLAGFSSSVMATWAPGLHAYYSKTIDALHSRDPSLKRIFPSSVFSAVTYNLGPRTTCSEHTDSGNLAFGMCSITPVGKFDHTQGGHLILWDLHLVIEFPAGSTILLPSAIVAHSNVKIASHENRYSFVQYTAGALFRWVDNNMMPQDSYLASLSDEELEDARARDAARWNFGLSLIPTFPGPT